MGGILSSKNKIQIEEKQNDAPFGQSPHNEASADNKESHNDKELAPYLDIELTRSGIYYLRKEKPRGYALVINNIKFRGQKPREGAEQDAERLKKTLTELGFEVDVIPNRTKAQMIYELQSYADSVQPQDIDILIIVIMTHGADRVLYGVDGSTITWDFVVTTFDNINCPNLRGKPKLIFFQACRGTKNVDPASLQEDITDCPPDLQQIANERDKDGNLKISDTLISCPAYSGDASFRDPAEGSPYIKHLCAALDVSDEDDELFDVLREITNRMAGDILEFNGKKYTQTHTVEQYNFTKELFLKSNFEEHRKIHRLPFGDKVWNVPTRDPNFVGRNSYFTAISNKLNGEKNKTLITVCRGIGGVGKTSLVTEYVWRHLDQYKCIAWFAASTNTQLLLGYKEFCTKYRIIKATVVSDREYIRGVKKWFQEFSDWLIVYDNAPSYETIKDYIPMKNRDSGKILITSWNPFLQYQHLEIYPFEVNETRQLVETVLGEQSEDDVDVLGESLCHLPLALMLSCCYIKQKQISIKEYLEDYNTRKESLTMQRPASLLDEEVPVYLTSAITMDEEPSHWLIACSFLSTNRIPYSFFHIFFDKGFSDEGRSAEDFSDTLNEYLRTLNDYRMLEIDQETKDMLMHGVLQDVIQSGIRDNPKSFQEHAINLSMVVGKSCAAEEINKRPCLVQDHLVCFLEKCAKFKANNLTEIIPGFNEALGMLENLRPIVENVTRAILLQTSATHAFDNLKLKDNQN